MRRGMSDLHRVGTPDTVVVEGGRPLSGHIPVSGFKHSLVTACAAAMAGRGIVRLRNCPLIEETRVLATLLRSLGGRVHLSGTHLTLDLDTVSNAEIDPALSSAIHGAVYLLPGLLSRFGRASMPATGGCRLLGTGSGRPVEHYARVLELFGAHVTAGEDGSLSATAARLRGTEVDLRHFTSDPVTKTGPLYSGATKMAIACAAMAHGPSTLHYPYPKPDVTDMVTVLRDMGAAIQYRSADELVVEGRGPEALTRPVYHELISDLIEVVTWTCLSVLADAPLRITGLTVDRVAEGLAPELRLLRQMGIELDRGPDFLRPVPPAAGAATGQPPLTPVAVEVVSRGIYSDSQPLLSLLSARAGGRSTFRETVWRGRFGHAPGLAALGVRLRADGDTLHVHGPCPPYRPGQRIAAVDLRSAASLLVAALCVPGRTVIDGCHHLGRGYERLEQRLEDIGARLLREDSLPVAG